MWGMLRTTGSCVDVVIGWASFSSLDQDIVKTPLKKWTYSMRRKAYCKVGVLGIKLENWADPSMPCGGW